MSTAPSTSSPIIGNTTPASPFMIAYQWCIIWPGSGVSDATVQVAAHQSDRELDDRPPIDKQQHPADHQQHRRAEVLAERDLALLAGLFPAMGRRFK